MTALDTKHLQRMQSLAMALSGSETRKAAILALVATALAG